MEVCLQPFPHGLENRVFGLNLSEYHTGYRAFRREVLDFVNFEMNSDAFIFDQEIMAQIVELKLASLKFRCRRATSRRHRRRHSGRARAMDCRSSGCWCATVAPFRIVRQRQFESLQRRYHGVVTPVEPKGRKSQASRRRTASCRDRWRSADALILFLLRAPADLAAVQSRVPG